MIKKGKIIGAYQLNMYCDYCGKRIDRKEFVVQTMEYRYECSCGNVCYSAKSFPAQQILFDEGNLEEVDYE